MEIGGTLFGPLFSSRHSPSHSRTLSLSLLHLPPRFLHQLPELPEEIMRTAKGVVLEDDIMAAFDVR